MDNTDLGHTVSKVDRLLTRATKLPVQCTDAKEYHA